MTDEQAITVAFEAQAKTGTHILIPREDARKAEDRECYHSTFFRGPGPWRVGRCAHYGNSTVVELYDGDELVFVDFVAYEGEGGGEGRGEPFVEAGEPGDFERLVERMLSGASPDAAR